MLGHLAAEYYGSGQDTHDRRWIVDPVPGQINTQHLFGVHLASPTTGRRRRLQLIVHEKRPCLPAITTRTRGDVLTHDAAVTMCCAHVHTAVNDVKHLESSTDHSQLSTRVY